MCAASGPCDRGDIDDAAGLALDEVRRDRLAGEEDRLEVHRVRAVPVLLAVVGERHARRRGHPGVVHQDVDLPHLLPDAVERGLHVGRPWSRRSACRCALRPSFCTSRATNSALPSWMSGIATSAPSRAMHITMPSPMPEPPPVTTATLPCKSHRVGPFVALRLVCSSQQTPRARRGSNRHTRLDHHRACATWPRRVSDHRGAVPGRRVIVASAAGREAGSHRRPDTRTRRRRTPWRSETRDPLPPSRAERTG